MCKGVLAACVPAPLVCLASSDHIGQKWASDPKKLELQTVVRSHEIELGASGHLTISPAS